MRKVLWLVLAIGLAACAGEDAESPAVPVPSSVTVTTGATDATDTPPTDAESGEGATIEIDDLSFGEPVTIAAGETVRVVNNDTVAHTWTSEEDLFDVSLDPGDEGSFTFEEPGTYSFVCEIHPSMAGSVTVEG